MWAIPSVECVRSRTPTLATACAVCGSLYLSLSLWVPCKSSHRLSRTRLFQRRYVGGAGQVECACEHFDPYDPASSVPCPTNSSHQHRRHPQTTPRSRFDGATINVQARVCRSSEHSFWHALTTTAGGPPPTVRSSSRNRITCSNYVCTQNLFTSAHPVVCVRACVCASVYVRLQCALNNVCTLPGFLVKQSKGGKGRLE